MQKDIILSSSISPNQRINIGKELNVTFKIPRDIGNISDFMVLFNREGEQPSIIKRMVNVDKGDNFDIYNATVRFNKLEEYHFFFSIKIDGKQKAIKINRQSRGEEPIILFTNIEAPYWRTLVVREKIRTTIYMAL